MSSCGYYDPSQTPSLPPSGGGSGDGTGGGWDGAEPGNGAYLAAQAIPGGIRVRWDYPSVNPHAVAHVLVYRSASEDFSTAGLRTLIDGTEFLDLMQGEHHQQFYYWVRFVTLSGARLDPLGPVAGDYDPTLAGGDGQTEPELVGLSDLTSDLQSLMARIEPLEQALASEVLTLEEADNVLAQALDDINRTVTDRLATMQTQVDAVANIHTEYGEIANDLAVFVNDSLNALRNEVGGLLDDFKSNVEIIVLTQSQYDGLTNVNPNALYVITE